MPNHSSRNFEWAYRFADILARYNVQNVCISPGSRSTPLTLAFAKHPHFKVYNLVDERSSAFFALGLAKKTHQPTVLICTSGTATANFFPAIIEASYSHIPLIVCTADRPPELQNTGANQTIDQQRLYGNKVRYFADMGLPNEEQLHLSKLAELTELAYSNAMMPPEGPVHLNFPFRKPLEPASLEILQQIIQEVEENKSGIPQSNAINANVEPDKGTLESVKSLLEQSNQGVIFVGPKEYNPEFRSQVYHLAKLTGFPIIADGASNLRFTSDSNDYVISTASTFLRSEEIRKQIRPDLILRFGRMPTTNVLSDFLSSHSEARQILINSSGKRFDASNSVDTIVRSTPAIFIERLNQMLLDNKVTESQREFGDWIFQFEQQMTSMLTEQLENTTEFFEGKVFEEILTVMPEKAPLIVSSSMPIRDLDYYGFPRGKEIPLYFNRGVSGIDGVTSTALGIITASDRPGILVTGDLAFYHDLNGLLAAKKYQIPLTVVLINNDGGGIFNMLPISKFSDTFQEQFITAHGLDFEPVVKMYNGQFYRPENWKVLRENLQTSLNSSQLNVIEIKTDGKSATETRKEIWGNVVERA